MQISELQPHHLSSLHGLYLALVAQAPHCLFKPGLSFFRTALERSLQQGNRMLVAEVGGMAHGLAALSRILPDPTGMPRDAITALYFSEEGIGRTLIEACETLSQQGDAGALLAFPNTHHYSPVPGYNGGWDGLSDRIQSTGRLLARSGFHPCHRQLHLTCDLPRFPAHPNRPALQLEISETSDDHGRRTLRVHHQRQAIGVVVYGTLTRTSDDPETRDWGYIWGFGVEEPYRRRGIARFLLSSALAQLRADGCQGCWMTVTSGNWASLSLALTLGFDIVDGSTSFIKTLR